MFCTNLIIKREGGNKLIEPQGGDEGRKKRESWGEIEHRTLN